MQPCISSIHLDYTSCESCGHDRPWKQSGQTYLETRGAGLSLFSSLSSRALQIITIQLWTAGTLHCRFGQRTSVLLKLFSFFFFLNNTTNTVLNSSNESGSHQENPGQTSSRRLYPRAMEWETGRARTFWILSALPSSTVRQLTRLGMTFGTSSSFFPFERNHLYILLYTTIFIFILPIQTHVYNTYRNLTCANLKLLNYQWTVHVSFYTRTGSGCR